MLKTTGWLVFLGILLFGIYSVLPPIKDSLASMLGGSSAVFSYLVNGKQELKKDGGKTNILLMGIDKRADEEYTYQDANGIISKYSFRTDTMIVASYNYDSKKVTMLSFTVSGENILSLKAAITNCWRLARAKSVPSTPRACRLRANSRAVCPSICCKPALKFKAL